MNLKTAGRLLSAEHEKRVFVGSWVAPKGGAVIVTDKASGEPIFESGLADAADVAASAEVARGAQAAWARRPATARADVLRKFAQLVQTHSAEISSWIVRESGSIPPKGDFEIGLTIREALEVASLAGAPVGQMLSTTGDKRSFAQPVPIGVVGVITPWNSPLILAARAMLPALVLGNAVILKPDVQTPASGGHLIARLFEEAGLPAGVLHVLPGAGDTGEALVRHPVVGVISFTGSTAVGRRVGEIAGGMLKRVALELGGNNALIVMRLLALVAALAPLSCMAHGLEAGGGLARGLLHPIGGADHLLAMVGVGIVSTKLGGRWIWGLPLTFLVAMTLGFWLGAAHPDGAQRASEWGVLLSVLVLGALTAIPKAYVPAMAWTAALLFGVCHGHAHGAELPGHLSPWAFSAGFLLATAGFHLMGAIVGSLCQHQPRPARNFAVVGATVGLAGIVLVVKTGL